MHSPRSPRNGNHPTRASGHGTDSCGNGGLLDRGGVSSRLSFGGNRSMAHGSPIPLTSVLIGLNSREFEAISGWPFADPFVARLLRDDIPQRVQYGNCRIWTYRDPDGRLVG